MKRYRTIMGTASLIFCTLVACTTQVEKEEEATGSLSADQVMEALQSPQIAVTPRTPGWLLEPQDIHLLSNRDKLKLVKIAQRGLPRNIPIEYYENEELGSRHDNSHQLFYLYASDAQCLGCRVVDGDKILIDDLEIAQQDTKKLYILLMPYVKKMQRGKMGIIPVKTGARVEDGATATPTATTTGTPTATPAATSTPTPTP